MGRGSSEVWSSGISFGGEESEFWSSEISLGGGGGLKFGNLKFPEGGGFQILII